LLFYAGAARANSVVYHAICYTDGGTLIKGAAVNVTAVYISNLGGNISTFRASGVTNGSGGWEVSDPAPPANAVKARISATAVCQGYENASWAGTEPLVYKGGVSQQTINLIMSPAPEELSLDDFWDLWGDPDGDGDDEDGAAAAPPDTLMITFGAYARDPNLKQGIPGVFVTIGVTYSYVDANGNIASANYLPAGQYTNGSGWVYWVDTNAPSTTFSAQVYLLGTKSGYMNGSDEYMTPEPQLSDGVLNMPKR
jgi:hypothetical protein